MENAVEALKMAGSVLLFVLALSVVIPLFSRARMSAEAVMAYSDRETEYLGVDELGEDFYFYVGDEDKKVRRVSLDTIIPAIYRSYKENTKIIFKNKGDTSSEQFGLYSYKKNGVKKVFNSIDLKYTSIPIGNEKTFIDGIVYGDFRITPESGESPQDAFERFFQVDLAGMLVKNKHGLYDELKEKINGGASIVEHLGVYYQEDVTNDDPDKIPETNKDEKRVITYEIIKPGEDV